MNTWNNSPTKVSPKLNIQTYQDAELLRFKIELEDEIKANPATELTKHLTRPFVEKEPDIPS